MESDTTRSEAGKEGQTLELMAGTNGRTTPYHPTRPHGTYRTQSKDTGNVTTAAGLCIQGIIIITNYRTRTGRTEY